MTSQNQALNLATRNAIQEIIDGMKKSFVTIRKFENRVVNVRLEKALQENGIRVYLGRDYAEKHGLKFWSNNSPEKYTSGRNNDSYWAYPDVTNHFVRFVYHEDEKRLDSEKTIALIEEQIAILEGKSQAYNFSDEKIEEYRQQLMGIEKQVKDILNSLNSAEREALRKVSNFYNVKL